MSGGVKPGGGGVLRSTDPLLAGSTSSTLGRPPVKKGVTFNLDNDDNDDDDDDDDSISQPIRDTCRYCTVRAKFQIGWLRGPAVERWSLADVLSLSCARLVADG